MWGSYITYLRSVSGFTPLSVCAWNIEWRGTHGHHSLQSWNVLCSLHSVVRQKTPPDKYEMNIYLCLYIYLQKSKWDNFEYDYKSLNANIFKLYIGTISFASVLIWDNMRQMNIFLINKPNLIVINRKINCFMG
jgi:hypothetical protein